MPIIHLEDGIPPSKSRIVKLGGLYTATVASGAEYTKTFTPPKGVNWTVINAYLRVGAPGGGAASGVHSFAIKVSDKTQLFGESVFSSIVQWYANMWTYADSQQNPSTEVGALLALHKAVVDNEYPLVVAYSNDTDVSNTSAQVIIDFTVLETPII